MIGPDELFARATDPRQYDAEAMDWTPEGDADAPWPRFVRERLAPALGPLAGRSVIDLGCGTGHLALLFARLGAGAMTGLEPSARHAGAARRRHPGLRVVRGGLPRAPFRRAFDDAVAVLSLEHQRSLDEAYASVATLLRPGGRFVAIAGDPEFHRTPRWGLGLVTHARADGSLLVATTYPVGTVHDVIRPPEQFERAARGAGFDVTDRAALAPDEALIARDPRWRLFSGRPVAWLITAAAP
ncbi:MAG: methyltransferase domain-containing protein [Candidatus Eisenbacteria bacterium]|nr:methyltransferase domain-containing protein [Candidatus Eisenbacteria bacterium]